MRQNRSKGLNFARASEKKINKKVTRKWHFTYLPRSPPWTDFYQTWNERSPRGRNQPWQILWQSVQGFKFYRKSKFQFFPQESDVAVITELRVVCATVCLQWWKQTLEGGGAPLPQPTRSLGSFVSAPAAIAFLAYYIGHRTFPVEKKCDFFSRKAKKSHLYMTMVHLGAC